MKHEKTGLEQRSGSSVGAVPFPAWLAGILLGYGVLLYLHITWGRVTGDEGFFALSARNILDGMKPYRDFLFLQMPLLPYVYAGWFGLCGASIEAGRWFSAILGAASVVLISLACRRRAGDLAGVMGALLVACNLSFVFDTGTFKTQPLTIFLTACTVFVLADRQPRRPRRAALLATTFMSLAFFERLSLLPALLLLWIYFGWRLRGSLKAYWVLWTANVAVLLAGIACFWSQGNMLFDIYRWHQEYFEFPPWTWSHFASVLQSWTGNQFPILLLFLGATVLFVRRLLRQPEERPSDDTWFSCFLLLSYWGTTAIHFINVQSHPAHQTSLTPLAVVFAAITLAPLAGSLPRAHRRLAWLGLALVFAFSMPFEEWSLHFDGAGSCQKLREAVELIRPHRKGDDALLSFNPEIAVNANLKVPRGYEMGEFTYLPKMSDERCRQLKMTNLRKLGNDLASGRYRFFCVGNHELSVMSGQNADLARNLKALIDRNYQLAGTVTNYGQFFDEMFIYVARN